MGFPPGHFYSPIPSMTEVRRRETRIFSLPESMPGVDLNERVQRETIAVLAQYFPAIELTEEKHEGARFYYNNPNYGRGEAIIYAAMLRYLRPRHVIEIGSGYSTLLLLDTLDQMNSPSTSVMCIEPVPELLRSLLTAEDAARVAIHACAAQDSDLSWFEALQSEDILFVDSTHVSKVGSDVNFILFEVLPRLRSGVRVHFHDVYYPFEYPKPWVFGGRNWNEVYLIRAFLQFNNAFSIECFNSYLGQCHSELFRETDPKFLSHHGSSLWLRRL
jgi:predicted O-methyltransferase YrrM